MADFSLDKYVGVWVTGKWVRFAIFDVSGHVVIPT
jgi:hypothetical protein